MNIFVSILKSALKLKPIIYLQNKILYIFFYI